MSLFFFCFFVLFRLLTSRDVRNPNDLLICASARTENGQDAFLFIFSFDEFLSRNGLKSRDDSRYKILAGMDESARDIGPFSILVERGRHLVPFCAQIIY